jgi:hypothetical protein
MMLSNCSAVKFPDVAGSVIQLLMDFLGDTNTASALDVIFFVREIVETNEKLRAAILARLLDSFTQIRSSRVRAPALAAVAGCHLSLRRLLIKLKVNDRASTPQRFDEYCFLLGEWWLPLCEPAGKSTLSTQGGPPFANM